MNKKLGTNRSRKGKIKTTIWLHGQLHTQMRNEAIERRVTQQSLIENSLKERYSEVTQMERDAAIAERINRVDRRMGKLEQQIEMLSEAFLLFVRMWLASTPEVPQEKREAAIQQASIRYGRYLDQLGRQVQK